VSKFSLFFTKMKVLADKSTFIYWVLIIIKVTIGEGFEPDKDSTFLPVYSFFEKNGPFLNFESVLETNSSQTNGACASSLTKTKKAVIQRTLWALKCKTFSKLIYLN